MYIVPLSSRSFSGNAVNALCVKMLFTPERVLRCPIRFILWLLLVMGTHYVTAVHPPAKALIEQLDAFLFVVVPLFM